MISLDSSIIPAILIFLALIFLLNTLLFRPILRVMDEREARTSGLILQTRKELDHHMELYKRYQDTIKNARLEGYRRQETVRAEALKKRAEALEHAKSTSDKMIQESRGAIQVQVTSAMNRLETEAREIARGIAAALLERPV